MKYLDYLKSVTAQINKTNLSPASTNTALSRIFNSTSLRALAVCAAAGAAAGCGGNIDSNENIINVTEGSCSPVPTCPRPELVGYGKFDEDVYLYEDRWFRVNPETGEIHIVCDPTERDFCEEGETPEEDGCSPPVCPGAQEAMCDPIPSRKNKNAPYRHPNQANFPTDTNSAHPYSYYLFNDKLNYPVIYDNMPDCEEDETPEGDSYYNCDLMPTCENTIPYCDPLPRCQQDEDPITCTENPTQKFSNYDDCLEFIHNSSVIIQYYNMDLYPGIDLMCEEKYDPNINEPYYSPPYISINCLPTRECEDGEDPFETTLTVDIECGQWGSWTSVNEFALTCDPIKSCN